MRRSGLCLSFPKRRWPATRRQFWAYLRYSLYLGSPRRTRALREQLGEVAKKTYIPPFAFAEISLALDEKDRGFQELEAAYRERDSAFTFMMASPVFDGVRNDPHLAAILSRVGLPDAAWR